MKARQQIFLVLWPWSIWYDDLAIMTGEHPHRQYKNEGMWLCSNKTPFKNSYDWAQPRSWLCELFQVGVLTLSTAHRKLTKLQNPLTAAAGQVHVHWGTLASQSPPVCSICPGLAPRIAAVHMNTHHFTRQREHHTHFPHRLRGVWGDCAYLYLMGQFIPNVAYIVNMITRVTQGHAWEKGSGRKEKDFS